MDKNVFGEVVRTPKGQFFFFDVDTPNTQEKHPKNKFPSGKFDVTLGVPQDANLSKIKAECEKVANEAFKTTDGIEMPFANGDEKSMASMKGKIIIRAKCSKRPGLVDGDRERITEGEMQPGMWGRLSVTPMSYISGKTKGVTLILKNVQALTMLDFERFGGGTSAADDFDDEDDF